MSGFTGGAMLSARAKAERMGRSLIPSHHHPKARKVWVMLTLDGHEKLTPWAAKEKRRRRAANKVAKQARKVNR